MVDEHKLWNLVPPTNANAVTKNASLQHGL